MRSYDTSRSNAPIQVTVSGSPLTYNGGSRGVPPHGQKLPARPVSVIVGLSKRPALRSPNGGVDSTLSVPLSGKSATRRVDAGVHTPMPKAQWSQSKHNPKWWEATVDGWQWRLWCSTTSWMVQQSVKYQSQSQGQTTCLHSGYHTIFHADAVVQDITDNMEQAEQWLLAELEQRYLQGRTLQP